MKLRELLKELEALKVEFGDDIEVVQCTFDPITYAEIATIETKEADVDVIMVS